MMLEMGGVATPGTAPFTAEERRAELRSVAMVRRAAAIHVVATTPRRDRTYSEIVEYVSRSIPMAFACQRWPVSTSMAVSQPPPWQ